jgi:5-hydroxyisourate hydrolase
MSERPFITCHVLDTTTGKPAAGIAVTLELLSALTADNSAQQWTAETNSDGRVSTWNNVGPKDLNDVVADQKAGLAAGGQMRWVLRFAVEPYYGTGNTFWPEVVLQFAAKKEEEHYHVPLLLGPWSYTTYRGS